MRLTVVIHHDGPQYWSEVPELPGCFASGRTLTELGEALGEAIGLYVWDRSATIEPLELVAGVNEITAQPGP